MFFQAEFLLNLIEDDTAVSKSYISNDCISFLLTFHLILNFSLIKLNTLLISFFKLFTFQLQSFTKEKLIELHTLLKAFSESDAGKISKKVLFAAFPELIVVKGIGEPVLRHFVKVVRVFFLVFYISLNDRIIFCFLTNLNHPFFIQMQYKDETKKNGEIKSLGQFVNALTRYELNQEDIKDILGNLEKLTGTNFDEAKVRK